MNPAHAAWQAYRAGRGYHETWETTLQLGAETNTKSQLGKIRQQPFLFIFIYFFFLHCPVLAKFNRLKTFENGHINLKKKSVAAFKNRCE